jgi:hypothetical protein
MLFELGCDDSDQNGSGAASSGCPLPAENPQVVALEGSDGVVLALTTDGSVFCWGDDNPGACAGRDRYRGLYLYPHRSTGVSCIQTLFSDGGASIGTTALGETLIWGEPHGAFGPANERSVAKLPIKPEALSFAAANGPYVLISSRDGLFWQGELVVDDQEVVAQSLTPVSLPSPARSLDVATNVCAAVESGALYCWGQSRHGELGLGVAVSSLTPALVAMPVPVVEVAVGLFRSCVRDELGQVYCAGHNTGGSLLGAGYPEDVGEFTLVEGLPPIDHLWTGGFRVCGTSAGELWCLGNPASKLEGVEGVIDVALSDFGTCVLRLDGVVLCNGDPTGSGNCGQPFTGWHQVDLSLNTCPGAMEQ